MRATGIGRSGRLRADPTAAFNRNTLNDVNRLVDGAFDPKVWIPRQFYDERHGRIEPWLESASDQTVRAADEIFWVGSSDRIRTENSCKYDVIEVVALAAPAWTPLHVGCDADERFSVFLSGR